MNVKDIEARVAEIICYANDDEVAHSKEDELYSDLLRAIADGKCSKPRACAIAALETKNLTFARWTS